MMNVHENRLLVRFALEFANHRHQLVLVAFRLRRLHPDATVHADCNLERELRA